jgi:hypothetical protein
MNRLPAVERAVAVALTPAQAFELFTVHMARWWPFAGHSCSQQEGGTVDFEPRVGGAVTEVGQDGRRHAWGILDAWDPPNGFAMSWHPGLPEAEATRLEVSFVAEAAGTLVRVRHDGWEARGEQAGDKRDQYENGWGHVLSLYAAAALAGSRP